MTDYTTKHEPVDDYPYICYAPDADANTETSGGGGSGGGGVTVFDMIFDDDEVITYIDAISSVIFDACSNGIVKISGEEGNVLLTVVIASLYDSYSFGCMYGDGQLVFFQGAADEKPILNVE